MRQRRCIQDEQITPGVIVVYTLRPDQQPRQPDKQWHGKVLYVYPARRICVASLEEGYEGCEEDVWLEQVVRIKQNVPTSPTNGFTPFQ